MKIQDDRPSQFTPPAPPKEFVEFAEGMEAQFAEQMIKEMRKSVPRDTPPSSAEDFYNGIIDYERAQTIAKDRNNLGIKDLILDQVYYQKLRNIQARNEAMNAFKATSKEQP